MKSKYWLHWKLELLAGLKPSRMFIQEAGELGREYFYYYSTNIQLFDYSEAVE